MVSNISGRPKDMVKSEKTCNSAIKWLYSNVFSLKRCALKGGKREGGKEEKRKGKRRKKWGSKSKPGSKAKNG